MSAINLFYDYLKHNANIHPPGGAGERPAEP